jgi:hypothetical protein
MRVPPLRRGGALVSFREGDNGARWRRFLAQPTVEPFRLGAEFRHREIGTAKPFTLLPVRSPFRRAGGRRRGRTPVNYRVPWRVFLALFRRVRPGCSGAGRRSDPTVVTCPAELRRCAARCLPGGQSRNCCQEALFLVNAVPEPVSDAPAR